MSEFSGREIDWRASKPRLSERLPISKKTKEYLLEFVRSHRKEVETVDEAILFLLRFYYQHRGKTMSEADFWSWVASEKRRLDAVLEQVEEVPTLLEYIERELQVARDTAFSLSARGEKENAAYWTGYADALEDLLKKIERREVRA
ncbi:hypothetical protein, conserved [Thermococcus kodakarensis KOD1]|uniref:Uncharacterized protein n=1 Tax=Thermococcus kodakarensis (strain ATCC BAA-918 / JCM 12380 / KOD1) TaxID=69014 RepID=Q5JD18_THEKO|nr:hypothetical protein [Thermococcus kodakarensis]WCN28484.1 hypothetical protein POG15_02110 [Thermococcus kodakarensis]WCN30780.1 hypothetical protein POG21_02110 [Thermococcus kodakarensis]BAD84600.1 hypothetical protein, conserved [Thermococcus kodakarensis KOD1]